MSKHDHLSMRCLLGFAIMACAGTGTALAINSVHPLGGRRGTEFEVVIPDLGAAKSVWFDSDQLTATVLSEPDGKGGARTRMQVRCSADANLGYHLFRVIQPHGIMRPLPLLIHDDPQIVESDTPHQTPQEAQTISWPCAVHGRVGQPGEVDYYALEVAAGDDVSFELNTSSGLIPPNIGARLLNEPEMSLLAPTGSWFDKHRPVRLQVKDESTFFHWPPRLPAAAVINHLPRFTHRFEKAGWYLIEVREREGFGTKDHCYQLRIVSTKTNKDNGRQKWTPRQLIRPRPFQWQERDFTQPIEIDWLRKVSSRTGLPAPSPATSHSPLFTSDLPALTEQEPNEHIEQARLLTVPVVAGGIIESAGDQDIYRIEIAPGARLCFELRTPDLPHPHFSPRLDVLDAKGSIVLSNIYTKVAGDGDDWVKSLEPKTIHTFAEGGDYQLRISDLTGARGGPRCAYQLAVRPQLPHVGEVVLTTFGFRDMRFLDDAINIKPGQTKKLVAVVEKEEGYQGPFAMSIQGLPPGVDLLPLSEEPPDVSFTGQVYESRGKHNKNRYRPQREALMLLLRAAKDAPQSGLTPHFVTLTLWPQQEGKPLDPIPGHQVPLMVVP